MRFTKSHPHKLSQALKLFLLARESVILDIPFIKSANPESIATTQNDITGNPIIMIRPTKNRIKAAIPLHPT